MFPTYLAVKAKYSHAKWWSGGKGYGSAALSDIAIGVAGGYSYTQDLTHCDMQSSDAANPTSYKMKL